MPGVSTTILDQCQLGQRSSDGQPLKKPTRWMSNSEDILEHLDRRCAGKGKLCSATGTQHATCSGKTAKEAAIYPFQLCETFLRGFRQHLDKCKRLRSSINAVLLEGADDESLVQESAVIPALLNCNPACIYESTTGQLLKNELVAAARREEMQYFEAKKVWEKCPTAEAFQKTGKPPVSVKWVDTNKGDDIETNYRSRLVAREVRRKAEDSIFAPTLPLESLRTILSLVATEEYWPEAWWTASPTSDERLQVSLVDIPRAYFNARTRNDDPVYVALPPEDPHHGKGLCGRLLVHMYGTRRAADGWHTESSEALEELGFVRGQSSACVFWHPERHVISSVHGDDFVTAGTKAALDWFKMELTKKYEFKEAARLGPGPQDDKQGRILNRVVTWIENGLTYGADPRQAQKLIQELGLETEKGTTPVRSVTTPCPEAHAAANRHWPAAALEEGEPLQGIGCAGKRPGL